MNREAMLGEPLERLEEINPGVSLSPSQTLELVRAATLAPSPDNNQPWRFRFDQGKLLVYEDPARRLPSDVCSMFAMLALGAAVENVAVEATRHGLAAELLPLAAGEGWDEGESRGAGEEIAKCKMQIANCKLTEGSQPPTPNPRPLSASRPLPPLRPEEKAVVEIRFSAGAPLDRLAACLEARCTNRRPFSRQPVAGAALDQLTTAATRFEGCRVFWLTDRPTIRRLSKWVAVADRLRFERAEFHSELFRQLRLTSAEAERTRDGLDLRTLGLPPGGGLMLRSLKSWPLVRTFNRFGLSRLLTAPSASLVRKSGALGILTVSQPTSESFLCAGRALERLWLTATDLGLSLHPLGSLPIFVGHHELLGGRALGPQTIQNPNSKIQNPSHHARLAALLTQRLRDLLPAISGQTLVMVVRLGASAAAPARSLRRPVEEVLDSNLGIK